MRKTTVVLSNKPEGGLGRRTLLRMAPILLALGRDALADSGEVKQMAPDWALPQWSSEGPLGTDLALSDLRGQWVYLDFWASWCVPCRVSFPWMGRLQARHALARLCVVAVGLDKQVQPMQQFLRQQTPGFTVLWDGSGQTASRYDVKAMPSSFLINPQGEIVLRHRGFQAASARALEDAIVRLMAVGRS